MRLQLRSSLGMTAEKVIGKQRLTVLVNVSFPAPTFDRWYHQTPAVAAKKGKQPLPFFIGSALPAR